MKQFTEFTKCNTTSGNLALSTAIEFVPMPLKHHPRAVLNETNILAINLYVRCFLPMSVNLAFASHRPQCRAVQQSDKFTWSEDILWERSMSFNLQLPILICNAYSHLSSLRLRLTSAESRFKAANNAESQFLLVDSFAFRFGLECLVRLSRICCADTQETNARYHGSCAFFR